MAICEMVAVLNHRGPDGRATYTDQAADGTFLALGHNRLSIIDLSENAAQPMRSRDGRYILIYNGELYNYREIAQRLDASELPDCEFGDTAVVLAALVKWGPQALREFNGMWALLLYDTQQKTILVSRDRFGVKPLYYMREDNRILFASEMKAIMAAVDRLAQINADVAVPFLTRGLLDCTEDTFIAGVRQFPAASYMVVNLREEPVRLPPPERFWLHPFEAGERPLPGSVSPEQLRELFLDAVRLRLRSDVPVGVLLSGGVDSSSIVGAISRVASLENITVLSVTSDDPSANEESFIDLMAGWSHLLPRKVNVSNDPLSLLNRVGEACWYNDAPITGIATVAHLRLMELARANGIKVLLTGQGADEQLGGYNKFFYFYLLTLLREGRFSAVLESLAQFAKNSNTLYEFRIVEAMRYVGRGWLAAKTFLSPEHHHRDTIDLGLQGSYAKREWIDVVKTSVPALLHYEDRMSMSQSVEVRVPFLDYRLVESIAQVHSSEKLAHGRTKAIFRTAIAGLVPKEIQYRRDKRGFTVPEDAWMRGVFKQSVSEMFNSGMIAEDLGLVDSKKLRRLYQGFLSGGGYLGGRHFFRVYAFETFLRRYSDKISHGGVFARN